MANFWITSRSKVLGSYITKLEQRHLEVDLTIPSTANILNFASPNTDWYKRKARSQRNKSHDGLGGLPGPRTKS